VEQALAAKACATHQTEGNRKMSKSSAEWFCAKNFLDGERHLESVELRVTTPERRFDIAVGRHETSAQVPPHVQMKNELTRLRDALNEILDSDRRES
jgi:hypothetical protein